VKKISAMTTHIISLLRLVAFTSGETLMVLSQVKQTIKAEEKAKEA